MLNEKAFGLAAGILWAFAALFLAITAGLWGYGADCVAMMGQLYLGYAPTFVGAIVGAIWAFIDAFIAFFIFAWLYNKLAK